MKWETPALASVSSREPAPIQKPSETDRTDGTRSEITRSPPSSSESTYSARADRTRWVENSLLGEVEFPAHEALSSLEPAHPCPHRRSRPRRRAAPAAGPSPRGRRRPASAMPGSQSAGSAGRLAERDRSRRRAAARVRGRRATVDGEPAASSFGADLDRPRGYSRRGPAPRCPSRSRTTGTCSALRSRARRTAFPRAARRPARAAELEPATGRLAGGRGRRLDRRATRA